MERLSGEGLIHFLVLECMTGKVEERELCDSEGLLMIGLKTAGHCPLKQRKLIKRRRNCFLTFGVKTQKRRELTNPWPESPMPCKDIRIYKSRTCDTHVVHKHVKSNSPL